MMERMIPESEVKRVLLKLIKENEHNQTQAEAEARKWTNEMQHKDPAGYAMRNDRIFEFASKIEELKRIAFLLDVELYKED